MMEHTLPVAALGDIAGQVFDDVRANGRKIITENNRPAFVIQTAEEYNSLMELLADMRVEQIAEERLSKPHGKNITMEEMMAECGITRAELDALPEVEIE